MPFNKEPIQDFIGKNICFPFVLENGRPKLETGFELIRSSIRMILGWPEGQRYFLYEFGSRIQDLLEEPTDFILISILKDFATTSIKRWEKRVTLINLDVIIKNKNEISMNISYRIVNSQSVDNFIFPFYTNIIY